MTSHRRPRRTKRRAAAVAVGAGLTASVLTAPAKAPAVPLTAQPVAEAHTLTPVTRTAVWHIRVRPGDTLSRIASRYRGVTWRRLCRINHLRNCDLIYPGQRLTVSRTKARAHRRHTSRSGVRTTRLTAAEGWLVNHESGNNTHAKNPRSSAFGLGQLIYANRARFAARLGVSPNTTARWAQVAMFRMYIAERYGSAVRAKAFWLAHGWY